MCVLNSIQGEWEMSKLGKIFSVACVYSPTACKVAAVSVTQICDPGYTVRSLCLQPE